MQKMSFQPNVFLGIPKCVWSVVSVWVMLSCGYGQCTPGSNMRISGPHLIHHDFRITNGSGTPFRTDSLLECYTSCVNVGALCGSASYEETSGECTVVDVSSWGRMEPAPGWVTINLTEQNSPAGMVGGTTTAASFCPQGFSRFEDKCYFIERKNQKTVSQAMHSCYALSAELLSIETVEEQGFLEELMTNTSAHWHLWTSGQGFGTNAYKWISTSKVVTYSNFSDGFPQDYSTDSCIYIDAFHFSWKTEACSNGINRFVCEYPITV